MYLLHKSACMVLSLNWDFDEEFKSSANSDDWIYFNGNCRLCVSNVPQTTIPKAQQQQIGKDVKHVPQYIYIIYLQLIESCAVIAGFRLSNMEAWKSNGKYFRYYFSILFVRLTKTIISAKINVCVVVVADECLRVPSESSVNRKRCQDFQPIHWTNKIYHFFFRVRIEKLLSFYGAHAAILLTIFPSEVCDLKINVL